MPYNSDTPIPITNNVNYIISSQHRRAGNVNKCLWTVSFENEVECFTDSLNNEWIEGKHAWGVRFINAVLEPLGEANGGRILKIAKFVDGNRINVWHGYPADPMTRGQDRPTTAILKIWVNNGYITKSKMSKIRLGQTCNL